MVTSPRRSAGQARARNDAGDIAFVLGAHPRFRRVIPDAAMSLVVSQSCGSRYVDRDAELRPGQRESIVRGILGVVVHVIGEACGYADQAAPKGCAGEGCAARVEHVRGWGQLLRQPDQWCGRPLGHRTPPPPADTRLAGENAGAEIQVRDCEKAAGHGDVLLVLGGPDLRAADLGVQEPETEVAVAVDRRAYRDQLPLVGECRAHGSCGASRPCHNGGLTHAAGAPIAKPVGSSPGGQGKG